MYKRLKQVPILCKFDSFIAVRCLGVGEIAGVLSLEGRTPAAGSGEAENEAIKTRRFFQIFKKKSEVLGIF